MGMKLKRISAAAPRAIFSAAVKDSTLELLVYEDIGENFWTGEGVTAKSVAASINAATGFDRIALRINSPGGDAFEGVAIFNLLRAQKKPIDTYIDGIAASAASIIAMAGDSITMGSNAMMMVHNAWTLCIGDAGDMRKCAEVLDAINVAIGQTYVDRTGQSAASVKAIMDAETWMGAEECLAQGFCTAISKPDEAAAQAQMRLASSFKTLAKLKNVPETLKPRAEDEVDGCDSMDCTAEDCDCGQVANKSNLSQYEARLKLL